MTDPPRITLKLESKGQWLAFMQWLHGLCDLLHIPMEQGMEMTSLVGSLSWITSCALAKSQVGVQYKEDRGQLTFEFGPLRAEDLSSGEGSPYPAALNETLQSNDIARLETLPDNAGQKCVVQLDIPKSIEPQLIDRLNELRPEVEHAEDLTPDLIFERYQEILSLSNAVRNAQLTNDELTQELAETNEGVLALYGVLEDKAAKLSELNQTLEQRVNERTAEAENRAEQLRALVTQLVHAEHRERERLAHTLHDHLQQLLVAARMRVEMTRGRSSDGKQDLAEVLKLLDESISVSRDLTVELSPPVLHQSGLLPALHWLAERFEVQYKMKVKVELTGKAPEIDQDQRLLLYQAVQELLFNAVKHAKVDQVQIRIVNRKFVPMSIEVIDKGQGVDPDRVLKTDVREGHFGLLNIVERMEWLGGRLEVESKIGEGTTMRLVIPQAPEDGTTPIRSDAAGTSSFSMPSSDQPQSAPSPQSRGIRVAIIDDHKMLREGLRMILDQQDDIEVVAESANGLDGLQVCKDMQPDVALMDVNMPKLDGIEATRRVSVEAPGVRVIGLSMHDSSEIGQAMREAGAVNYLTKGVSPDDLCTAVRKAASKPVQSE